MSNTTVSSVSRTRRIALTILGSATVAAGGLALAPHAGATENPTKTPPAAVAPAQQGDGDMNSSSFRTKGFIIKNNTGKHFHVTSVKGEFLEKPFENQPAIGTDLAPGHEMRWEMYNMDGLGNWALFTYAADDGSQVTVKTYASFFNSGQIDSITTPNGAKPVNTETGYDYDTSAYTITLNN